MKCYFHAGNSKHVDNDRMFQYNDRDDLKQRFMFKLFTDPIFWVIATINIQVREFTCLKAHPC